MSEQFKTVRLGKTERVDFSKIQERLKLPYLLENQISSYQWFITEGFAEIFKEISGITNFDGNIILNFVNFVFDKENPIYTLEECKRRRLTYAAPLKVTARLYNTETNLIKESDVFLGNFPLMTETGTFIINGNERVIISQLVRSPGIYCKMDYDKTGKKIFSSSVIPNRGAWLEYETDGNNVFFVRIDKNRKLPITILIKAFGLEKKEDIIDYFGNEPLILGSLEKETCENKKEALFEIYKRAKPGEPPTLESSQNYINSLLFDFKRYDLAHVGRHRFNDKLSLKNRLKGQVLAKPVLNPLTGEIIADIGEKISFEKAKEISDIGVESVNIDIGGQEIKIISNGMVDASKFVDFDLKKCCNIKEKVRFNILSEILENYDDSEQIKAQLCLRRDELIPRHIIVDDIFASINYLICLSHGIGNIDDIDHLGNRRVRCVGELLQNQLRVGFARLERVIRERMTLQAQDLDVITPHALINIRPVVAAVKEFFCTSPLSQFMDNTNPLAELTHKRRLSSLGPGGLSRDRASLEVRDVHYSHYGRICPIETPEGSSIGLILYLATFAKINEYGFIECPYNKVDKLTGAVTDEIVYMTADEEDEYVIAQANEPLDENRKFLNEKISGRYRDEFVKVERKMADFMDVSPKMMISVATSMIPFLENDDANRALMASNMQKQAVPLIRTETPIVATGTEYYAGIDSGVCVVAKEDGIVDRVSSAKITVTYDFGKTENLKLVKFKHSNQNTCINQNPIVNEGDRFKKGDVLADGFATKNGEIALGKNALIAFMAWEGYNHEDAVLISERIVRDDIYTSIHIKEYEIDARDTKLGPEEITRDIPNVGEVSLKNLDANGIVQIGVEVKPGDILVGKVTPKGETELTAEERLLRAIFGEKAREMRDTSLRLPHGESGIVIDVKVFTKETCKDEMQIGINKIIRVFVAQKRKLSVGDKMAGRHGNKGVVSKIMSIEDMPFLPDGTPVDIVLNPLGVPARMNLGQILEMHLGYAAKILGLNVMTPVFDGARESDIAEFLKKAGINPDGKIKLRDGRTGEYFKEAATVGYMYYLKLDHLVDDKMHARSTGPYSIVTQQPLGGKAQLGGQRFGEMEVWALEAYGAAYTLQEILTVKSDDINGRLKTYEAIVKGLNIPHCGIPESFKVLVKELQSMGLDIRVLNKNNEEIDLRQNFDAEDEEITEVLSGNTLPETTKNEKIEVISSDNYLEEGIDIITENTDDDLDDAALMDFEDDEI